MLSAAALMIGAIGFGQVQVGPNTAAQATPVANQSVDPNANTGVSSQSGNGQEVAVIQIGSSNSVRTTQGDGVGLGDNKIRVEQVGPMFGPISFASNNEAEANQLGTDNQTTIDQESGYNDARVDQGLTSASEGNRALVEQGFDGDQFFETRNYSFLQQDGSDNSASTKQTNDNNDAWVDQDGDDNRALVEQHSTPNALELVFGDNRGNSSFVRQDGENNQARVNQDTDGSRNNADLRQYGRANLASQTQINPSSSDGDENSATIRQGIMDQWTFDANWAEAHQVQEGSGNTASILQNDNAWGERTYAEQNQDGDDNTATINQQGWTGPSNGSVDFSYARQDQDGDSNSAYLSQDGSSGSLQNMAYQLQDGDDNFVTSSQYGNDNKLNTLQYGDDNYAATSQIGSYNAALVVQHDGQSYTLAQNGNGNQANIYQAGALGPNSPEECSFEPQIVWDPVPVVPSFDPADVCVDCN